MTREQELFDKYQLGIITGILIVSGAYGLVQLCIKYKLLGLY